jgi:hypothetical protein
VTKVWTARHKTIGGILGMVADLARLSRKRFEKKKPRISAWPSLPGEI